MTVRNIEALLVVATILVGPGIGCKSSETGKPAAPQHQETAVTGHADFVNTAGLRMVWVEPGTFVMGFQRAAAETPATPELQELERPHDVTIHSGFWISSTEVTAAQYDQAITKSPTTQAEKVTAADSLPVSNVSWEDAMRFCESLSRAEGRTYRLPTVEEWEFACRGGAGTNPQKRATRDELTRTAWFHANSGGQVHPVAKLGPNSLGLYDMQGNVFEWCMTKVPQKFLADTPYQGRDCAFIRGGYYQSGGERSCDCGSAYGSETIDHKSEAVGFRIVCAP